MSLITESFLQAAGYDVWYLPAGASGDYLTLGAIENNDEFRFSIRKHMEYFTGAPHGKTELDAIYNGKKVLLSMVLQEINSPAALSLVDPETSGNIFELGQPGTLTSPVCGELKLQPHYSSLPTLTVATNTIMYLKNFCVEDQHEIQRMLRSGRSTIPLILNVMPWIDETDDDTIKFASFVNSVN